MYVTLTMMVGAIVHSLIVGQARRPSKGWGVGASACQPKTGGKKCDPSGSWPFSAPVLVGGFIFGGLILVYLLLVLFMLISTVKGARCGVVSNRVANRHSRSFPGGHNEPTNWPSENLLR